MQLKQHELARDLTEACSEVVKNKGAGGIDRMSVGQLKNLPGFEQGRTMYNHT